MRRIAILITTLALTMSGLAIVPAQAKAKVTKPSAPTVSALSSSAPKKGKVNVTITITLPVSDGGSKITGIANLQKMINRCFPVVWATSW